MCPWSFGPSRSGTKSPYSPLELCGHPDVPRSLRNTMPALDPTKSIIQIQMHIQVQIQIQMPIQIQIQIQT